MPYQNRVTPRGQIEFSSARGLFMGNRGILHNDRGQLGRARWRHKNWVCCVLDFKGRKQTINAPSHYTQLFFLDEAVALAAGHRPCAECRRADHKRYVQAWRAGHGIACDQPLRARDLDRDLHAARIGRDPEQLVNADALPDGSFVALDDKPDTAFLVWKGLVHRWSHEGYIERRIVPVGEVRLLTPLPTVHALAAGYRPAVHPSAND